MASDSLLHAVLQMRRGDDSRVGAERIALLKAIGEHGSISAGARAVGITYRAAWDAVQALNNLFERPLVVGQTGGKAGGGALLTPVGEAVIAGFEHLDAALQAVMGQLHAAAAAPDEPSLDTFLWSLGMKTSARNAYRGVVEKLTEGAVSCEVTLRISEAVEIVALVTKASVEELGLKPGAPAVALVKSSFVILAPGDEPLRTSARNRLTGVVVRHETGAVNDEITLELDVGKTLTATITRESGESLPFNVGDKAQALIKASHVILAVE
jgi:molybdate transport system regulatory protein